MRTAALTHFIELATKWSGTYPLAKLISASIEVGTVFPSKLKSLLEAAGYTITPSPATGSGAWVKITEAGVQVAQGYSHDENDALLQAVYAWLKETT